MFISSTEKQKIMSDIKNLEIRINLLENEQKGMQLFGKKKRTVSPEVRAKMSQRMKEHHARKKQESQA